MYKSTARPKPQNAVVQFIVTTLVIVIVAGAALIHSGLLHRAERLWLILFPDRQAAQKYYSLGSVAMELGDYGQAYLDFGTSTSYDPGYAEGWLGLGQALFQAENREAQALAAIDRALLLKPDYYEAYIARADHYKELEQWDKVAADVTSAMALKADGSGDLYYLRSLALYHTGQAEAALSDVDQAVALAPHDAESHLLKGEVTWRLGQVEVAVLELQAAIDLQPTLNNSVKPLLPELEATFAALPTGETRQKLHQLLLAIE